MRKGKKDLTRAERFEIKILIDRGYSLRSIGGSLGRGKSTISYEIENNKTKGIYDPRKADAKARLRKRMRRLQWSKIEESPSLKRFIVEKLEAHWNPDEIAGYMKQNPKQCPGYTSKTAIYEWLRTPRGERYCTHLYSKRKRVKKRRSKKRHVLIPNRVGIERRFKGADNRTRYGHLEIDTIVGRRGTPGGLKVASDRKSRLIVAGKVGSMRPGEHARAEQAMLEDIAVVSRTYDNGIENRNHESVPIPSFFCDPYSSWQKGSVENANKMLRRYFPKGTDFRTVTQKELDRVALLINEKPRRVLGYRSALEIAKKAGMIKSIKNRVS